MKRGVDIAFVLVACMLVLLTSRAAMAASGSVTGQFLYFENQGNFCPDQAPTFRNCTGAKYLQSAHFNQNVGVPEAKVYVRQKSNSQIIGIGSTDPSGNYTVTWSTAGALTSQVRMEWTSENKDGRFAVRTSSGGTNHFISEYLTIAGSGNTNLGSFVWGSSTAPSAEANAYGGAERMWMNSLGQSALMHTAISNLEIRMFSSATCPTSCAQLNSNRILLDDNAAFSPQARVMHEMGHIATYKAHGSGYNGTGTCAQYSFPSTSCGAFSWDLTTAEWEAAGFEESVATHLADVALYFPNAASPHSCLSATACGTNSFNIETSLGTSCAANQERVPLNHMRYHWDNYDTGNDYFGENMNAPMWDVLDTLASYPPGTGNGQKNEASGSDLDGRSTIDFRDRWGARGVGSGGMLLNNCGSAGD